MLSFCCLLGCRCFAADLQGGMPCSAHAWPCPMHCTCTCACPRPSPALFEAACPLPWSGMLSKAARQQRRGMAQAPTSGQAVIARGPPTPPAPRHTIFPATRPPIHLHLRAAHARPSPPGCCRPAPASHAAFPAADLPPHAAPAVHHHTSSREVAEQANRYPPPPAWLLADPPSPLCLLCTILSFSSREVAEEHYKDLKDKPFFPDLIGYILSGPVVGMVSGARLPRLLALRPLLPMLPHSRRVCLPLRCTVRMHVAD